MQNEITKPTDLLNVEGNIAEPGFAKKMLYNYNRENVTAKKTRLKEWDYYYISNKEFALCLTISDMGFVGALSLTVMDFVTPAQFTNSAICLFPMGKFNMPRTSEKGDCAFKIGKVEMKFENDGEKTSPYGRLSKRRQVRHGRQMGRCNHRRSRREYGHRNAVQQERSLLFQPKNQLYESGRQFLARR